MQGEPSEQGASRRRPFRGARRPNARLFPPPLTSVYQVHIPLGSFTRLQGDVSIVLAVEQSHSILIIVCGLVLFIINSGKSPSPSPIPQSAAVIHLTELRVRTGSRIYTAIGAQKPSPTPSSIRITARSKPNSRTSKHTSFEFGQHLFLR